VFYLKRLYPEQPVVGIGVVVVKDGKLALIKRGNDPGKGKWSIPGGLVELGEHLEATVIREAQEETGLTVRNPLLVDVVDNVEVDGDGKVRYHYVIIDFLVEVVEGEAEAASGNIACFLSGFS